MNNYSLIDLMKNDFCFESLKEAKEETKKSKQSLDSTAAEYSKKYAKDIERGTRKRQLMLENAGIREGTLEAEEFFKDSNEFMPTVHTPILNMLYFLTGEYGEQIEDVSELKKLYEEKYGNLQSDYESKIEVDIDELNDLSENHADGIDDFDTGERVPHMDKYIYQNMDSGMFAKLKKLKQLSKSDNPQEAKSAWLKCMDICEQFDLDFEDIPCKYD